MIELADPRIELRLALLAREFVAARLPVPTLSDTVSNRFIIEKRGVSQMLRRPLTKLVAWTCSFAGHGRAGDRNGRGPSVPPRLVRLLGRRQLGIGRFVGWQLGESAAPPVVAGVAITAPPAAAGVPMVLTAPAAVAAATLIMVPGAHTVVRMAAKSTPRRACRCNRLRRWRQAE